jgi:hypothetical protein
MYVHSFQPLRQSHIVLHPTLSTIINLLQVIFEGETTFGYEEWAGPLVSISGTDITVTASSGAYLNGDGSRWWDGEGSNGGKTKPKFFYAHNMIFSSITGIYIQNSPVQVFSIDGSTDLTLTDITIDDSDGDDNGAANTDAFDVGDSTGITISAANVANQDDCLAVNSGTVCSSFALRHLISLLLIQHTDYRFHWGRMLRRPWSLHWLCWRKKRQYGQRCYHRVF